MAEAPSVDSSLAFSPQSTARQTRLPRARWFSLRSWVVGCVLLLILWQLLRASHDDSTWRLSSVQPLAEGLFHCERVIDGDTLIAVPLADREDHSARRFTIRLLGIDTPEDTTQREPLGPEATAFTRSAVVDKTVRLQWDKRRIDRYGRRLAYVFVDDSLVNLQLVELGLARVFNYPGDNATIARDLNKAEQMAREKRLGIWNTPQPVAVLTD